MARGELFFRVLFAGFYQTSLIFLAQVKASIWADINKQSSQWPFSAVL